MLIVLDELALALAAGLELQPGSMQRVFAYFSKFLVEIHQFKESEFLFPAAAMMNFANAGESIGRLIADHDETAVLLASLGAVCGIGDLPRKERVGSLTLVQNYCARLNRHMDEEEEIFVLLGEFMSEEESKLMLSQFEMIDRRHQGFGHWEREVQYLESLVE